MPQKKSRHLLSIFSQTYRGSLKQDNMWILTAAKIDLSRLRRLARDRSFDFHEAVLDRYRWKAAF